MTNRQFVNEAIVDFGAGNNVEELFILKWDERLIDAMEREISTPEHPNEV